MISQTGRSEDYNTLSAIRPDKNDIESFLTVGNHDLYFNGWRNFMRDSSFRILFYRKITSCFRFVYRLDSGSGTLAKTNAMVKKGYWKTNEKNTVIVLCLPM